MNSVKWVFLVMVVSLCVFVDFFMVLFENFWIICCLLIFYGGCFGIFGFIWLVKYIIVYFGVIGGLVVGDSFI